MWKVKNKNSSDISMTEGDYGVSIPFTIKGGQIADSDDIILTIKEARNGDVTLTKTFTGITGNIVDLVFTQSESAILAVGSYVYTLDWYRDGVLMYCIIDDGKLKVEDKP